MIDLRIAAALCKQFEGFRSKPYLCPAGVATIGYGSTAYADGRRVTLSDQPITEHDAHALLMHELSHRYAPAVLRYCPSLAKNNDVLNAITDFCYNLGVGRLQTSTLRRKINAGDLEGASYELMKWTKGGGRVLSGLVRRRRAECLLIK